MKLSHFLIEEGSCVVVHDEPSFGLHIEACTQYPLLYLCPPKQCGGL